MRSLSTNAVAKIGYVRSPSLLTRIAVILIAVSLSALPGGG